MSYEMAITQVIYPVLLGAFFALGMMVARYLSYYDDEKKRSKEDVAVCHECPIIFGGSTCNSVYRCHGGGDLCLPILHGSGIEDIGDDRWMEITGEN